MYYAKKLWGTSGEVVYNFVPFVAPESFDDPQKYADFGCTVNLLEKLKIYRRTYPGADVAVEFSDEIEDFRYDMPTPGRSTLEVFETLSSGAKTNVLYTNKTFVHTFTSGSTKRYMIRRTTNYSDFHFVDGVVWAYCFGPTNLLGYITPGLLYLKYVFLCENILNNIGSFHNSAITGTLTINGVVTTIFSQNFTYCTNLTKVIIGNNVTTIQDGNAFYGAFRQCTSLQIADLGTGISSIGTDAFRDCTSLASIICRAYNPPTLSTNAFYGIPTTTNFYVPNDSVDAYKMAAGWAEFASRIYSINDL